MNRPVVSSEPYAELVAHLCQSSTMATGEASRIIGEVLNFFSETTDTYVRRRHGELQAQGLRNPEIFLQMATELETLRVKPERLSQRQLRRLVYG